MQKITAAIITYNEEKRIERCLKSLDWVDEIVVIDSFSSDRTVDICKHYTQKVYQHSWPNNYAEQKTRSHEYASHDWILFIDADEVITRALRDEVMAMFKDGPVADAFGIPRREYFGGKWIKAGGWYPQYKIILYRKSMGGWVNPIHEKFVTRGTIGYLVNPILHDGYGNFKTFMDKFNVYSTMEAERTFFEGRSKFSLRKAIFKPLERFYGRFVRHRGYRDGMHGFYMAVVIAFNYFLAELKYYERLYETRNPENWDDVYHREAVGSDRDSTGSK